jgi:hypothetical protein
VDDVAVRLLHVAVADLYVLAGWTSFDVGLSGEARQYLMRALTHARFANESSLAATALCGLGAVNLHYGWYGEALRMMRHGQAAAHRSGLSRAVAMLDANLAWVQAVVGDERQALASLARADAESARISDEQVPDWLRFFDTSELDAVYGMTLGSLPGRTSKQRAEAIGRLTASVTRRSPAAARSRALDLTALACLHLDQEAADECVKIGNEGVDLAGRVSSTRLTDRMEKLRTRLAQSSSNPDLRDLAERINTLLEGQRGRRDPDTDNSSIWPVPVPVPPQPISLSQAIQRDRRRQTAPIKSTMDREVGASIKSTMSRDIESITADGSSDAPDHR